MLKNDYLIAKIGVDTAENESESDSRGRPAGADDDGPVRQPREVRSRRHELRDLHPESLSAVHFISETLPEVLKWYLN